MPEEFVGADDFPPALAPILRRRGPTAADDGAANVLSLR
jgi:hypothetical protein